MERLLMEEPNFWDPRWFRTGSTDLNWWNPLADRRDARVRAGPDGWKEIADAEIQSISSMSRAELFELTETISRTPIWPIGRQFLIYNRFQIFGETSADAYVSAFRSILHKLEDRLEDEWVIFNSLVNLRNIMAEKISTSDYTALWLVEKHIIKDNNLDLSQLETEMQSLNNYRDKLLTFIFGFNNEIFRRQQNELYINAVANLFRGDEQQAIEDQAAADLAVDRIAAVDIPIEGAANQEAVVQAVVEQEAEEAVVNFQPIIESSRPRRQRRPPDRLNIASTKGCTYQN